MSKYGRRAFTHSQVIVKIGNQSQLSLEINFNE
jgi:hypothetical protein